MPIGRRERSAYERANERNKVNVRWLLAALVAGYLSYVLWTGQGREIGGNHLFTWAFIAGLSGAMALLNAGFSVYLSLVARGRLRMHPLLKYLTMLTDFTAVSFVLIPTGGDESMFFVVYFIIIVSNSLRYGMRLAIAGLFAFNLGYAGVLAYQYWPGLELPHFQRELLKICGFWVVGLYTGYVARRFETLQGEVERYQQLVQKLMERRESPADDLD